MRALQDLLHRFDRRTILAVLALVLLGLNLGRFGWQAFTDWQAGIDNRVELLHKYQKAAGRIDALKQEVILLERQQQQLISYLFTGASEEEMASAMQILIQEEVVKAGLEPEFIQPSVVAAGSGGGKEGIKDIAIKVRLSGSLNGFAQFTQALYRSKKLFTIETFTLKPFKKEELKIFLEVKGYYAMPAGADLKR